MVVFIEIMAQPDQRFLHTPVVFQVDLFVLNRAPEPLQPDIIEAAAPTVHANRDALRQEPSGESQTGELAALVGVENLRLGLP